MPIVRSRFSLRRGDAIALAAALALVACSGATEMAPVAQAGPPPELDTAAAPTDAEQSREAHDVPVPIRPRMQARPLSLAELTQEATTIVHGTVTGSAQRDLVLVPGGDAVAVIETTIHVQEVLKGVVLAGQDLIVRQIETLRQPVKDGEEVLWYLAGESELGLSAPLGIYSGDFRVEDQPSGDKLAINLHHNAGLWSTQTSLIASGPVDAGEFRLAAVDQVGGDTGEVDALLRRAQRPNAESAVPLDFLVVASRAMLQEDTP